MRLKIIAGTLGGRFFESPHGHKTHPMSEKMRGAIFNALGDIEGLSLLDAFGGSGALAFEANSRGIGKITVVEIEKSAYQTIVNNAQTLGITSNITIVRANVMSWTKRNQKNKFDIVFCDPPYDKILYKSLLELAKTVKKNGIIVYSMPVDNDFKLSDNEFEKLTYKQYAGGTLAFYRRIS